MCVALCSTYHEHKSTLMEFNRLNENKLFTKCLHVFRPWAELEKEWIVCAKNHA